MAKYCVQNYPRGLFQRITNYRGPMKKSANLKKNQIKTSICKPMVLFHLHFNFTGSVYCMARMNELRNIQRFIQRYWTCMYYEIS
jgi:hypothetical protein